MHKLKAVVRRGALLSAAAVLATVTYLPAIPFASADALNPLTNRSLTLSSSSPGWDFKDGSGNNTYAAPNSGANGKQTGNTFDFKVSTDTTADIDGDTNPDPVKAFTFQYCTTSAGNCIAPGDNGYTATTRNPDSASTSDLNVVVGDGTGGNLASTEIANGDFGTIIDATDGSVKATPHGDIDFDAYYSKDTGSTPFTPNTVAGNYIVYYESAPGTWTQSTGWTMTVSNSETGVVAGEKGTGKNNFITLKNSTGQGFTAGTRVKVIFFATDHNYITNPGSGAFFVKINTYKDDTTFTQENLIDGGVTVANVMNHSISIQTKVLETMEFSVGTVDPYTLDSTGGAGVEPDNSDASPLWKANGKEKHGTCSRILTGMTPSDPVNVLELGDQDGENSLSTEVTYSTHSYWRLSSNSSAGATVYYSGVTLSNTVGDKIDAIGSTKEQPQPGKEQFGLALANGTSGVYAVNYDAEYGTAADPDPTHGKVYENGADFGLVGISPSVVTDLTVGGTLNPSYHAPQLAPLVPRADYSDGAGPVNAVYGTVNTKFAFDTNSNLIPVPIADQSSQVVDCVTGKMRYVANIAATTPAGIYTTKVNYIAAPQY